MEQLRELSSQILSYSKMIILNIGDISSNKQKLINAVNTFKSLLQYIYPPDILIIDLALEIEEQVCIYGPININKINALLLTFWLEVDLYVGADYCRIKSEIKTGTIFKFDFNREYEELRKKAYELEEIKKVKGYLGVYEPFDD